MKRLLLVWLLILCLLPVGGWAEESDQPLSSPNYIVDGNADMETGIRWSVISSRGNVLAEGTSAPYHDAPTLVYVEGSVIGLRESNGVNAAWYAFYDVAGERVSSPLEDVLGLRGENVLYVERQDDAWQIVLANVFSGEILRSMPVDIQTAGGWGVTETERDEESSTWLVTYLAGEEYEETTLIFPSGPDISLADETYPYASFIIVEKDGKYGIADPDGRMVLPPEYYIPTDQFDPDYEPVCVEVYQPVDGDYHIVDLDWELERGTVKAGFFHAGSGYFSQCIWTFVFASDHYVTVGYGENRYSLLDAKTGEVVHAGPFAWIVPYETEGWFYAWLPTEEMDEFGEPAWETVYVNLDGTILRAPDGCWFLEWNEPIENGMVPVCDKTGTEILMSVEEILHGD